MIDIEEVKKEIIEKLKPLNPEKIILFGSYAYGTPDANSDIDLIVEFANVNLEDYADNYFDLKFSLEEILKRPIDLLEEKAIKNPYFKQAVNQQRQLVYGH